MKRGLDTRWQNLRETARNFFTYNCGLIIKLIYIFWKISGGCKGTWVIWKFLIISYYLTFKLFSPLTECFSFSIMIINFLVTQYKLFGKQADWHALFKLKNGTLLSLHSFWLNFEFSVTFYFICCRNCTVLNLALMQKIFVELIDIHYMSFVNAIAPSSNCYMFVCNFNKKVSRRWRIRWHREKRIWRWRWSKKSRRCWTLKINSL